MGRRNVFDPLEPTREARWYTVRNMHGALVEARPLPAGSDLKRAFVAAMLEWIDAGWKFGEFGSTSDRAATTAKWSRSAILEGAALRGRYVISPRVGTWNSALGSQKGHIERRCIFAEAHLPGTRTS